MSQTTSTEATPTVERPYRGLLSFDEEQAGLFFGRSEEAEELARAVVRGSATLLYGVSGIGKSSLLGAGLFPALRSRGYLPIPIRLVYDVGDAREPTPPLLAQVRAAVERAALLNEVDSEPPPAGRTLWEHFQRTPYWNARGELTDQNRHRRVWTAPNDIVTPVLIFDQFEELFTLGTDVEEQIEELLQELTDLIENTIPASIRSRVLSASEEDSFSYDRLRTRVAFTLREDFLPHFEERIRSRIPSLATNRFRLKPMNGKQALEAAWKPAEHLVDEAVAAEMVYAVGSETRADGAERAPLTKLEIEPALLSLFCYETNERRIEQGKDRITLDMISQEHREAFLRRFYEDTLSDVSSEARRFVEEQLLTPSGARSVAPVEATGVPVGEIPRLIQRRLLRVRRIGRVDFVELVHDRLTSVVREGRDARRLNEEAARRKAERAEASAIEAKRQASLARRRRTRLVLTLAGLVVAGLLAITLITDSARREADVQRTIAQGERKEADKQRREAEASAAEAQRQRGIARTNEAEALRQEKVARENAEKARDQERIAKESAQEAERQRKIADQQRTLAETRRTEAEEQRRLKTEEAARAVRTLRTNEKKRRQDEARRLTLLAEAAQRGSDPLRTEAALAQALLESESAFVRRRLERTVLTSPLDWTIPNSANPQSGRLLGEGRALAVLSGSTVYVLDTTTGNLWFPVPLLGEPTALETSGWAIAAAYENGRVEVWECGQAPPRRREGWSWKLSGAARRLGFDGAEGLWAQGDAGLAHLEANQEPNVLAETGVTDLATARFTNTPVLLLEAQRLLVFDRDAGETREVTLPDTGTLSSLSVSDDGGRAAVLNDRGEWLVVDLQAGVLAARGPVDEALGLPGVDATGCRIDGEGRRIAIWDATDGAIAILTSPGGFASGGRQLGDAEAPADDHIVQRLRTHGWTRNVHFGIPSTVLWTYDENGIRLWQLARSVGGIVASTLAGGEAIAVGASPRTDWICVARSTHGGGALDLVQLWGAQRKVGHEFNSAPRAMAVDPTADRVCVLLEDDAQVFSFQGKGAGAQSVSLRPPSDSSGESPSPSGPPCVAIGGGGRHVLAHHVGHPVRAWDLTKEARSITLADSEQAMAVAVARDGTWGSFVDLHGNVRFHALSDGRLLAESKTALASPGAKPTVAALGTLRQSAAVAWPEGRVELFVAGFADPVRTLDVDPPVTHLSFVGEREGLLAWIAGGALTLYDVTLEEEILTWQLPFGATHLHVARDLSSVVYVSGGQQVHRWLCPSRALAASDPQRLEIDLSARIDATTRLEIAQPPTPATIQVPPAVTEALIDGEEDALRRRLALGLDPNARMSWGEGPTLLHAAVMLGKTEIAGLLLSAGADPNAATTTGKTALHMAVQLGDLALVRRVIESGGDAEARDTVGRTPLHYAREGTSLEIPTLLLAKGAGVGIADLDGKTALHLALEAKNAPLARLLVESGSPLDAADERGRLPLHYAADGPMREIVLLLIANGAVVDAPDRAGARALHQAVATSTVEVLEVLLEAGANPNQPEQNGWTPLHLAAHHGRLDVAQALAARGADLDLYDDEGWTALHKAVGNTRAGDDEFARVALWLIESGAELDHREQEGRTPLYLTLDWGRDELALRLIEAGADPNLATLREWTPLHTAAQNGRVELLKKLIAAKADIHAVDDEGWNGLHKASSRGHLGVVKVLVQAGIDIDAPDKEGWTGVHKSAAQGHVEILDYLLRHGALHETRTLADGWTPLHAAAAWSQEGSVRRLVEGGAKVDARVFGSDLLPIHLAAENGAAPIVRFLLDSDSPVTGRDRIGETLLIRAVVSTWGDRVPLLLERGADPNLGRTFDQSTPLLIAAGHGKTDLAKLLLEAGARVDAASTTRRTPLLAAAENGHDDMVALLLEAGADITLSDVDDDTPFQIALLFGHPNVALRLLEAGADPAAVDSQGNPPVVLAVRQPRALLEAVLARDVDLDATDGDGWTALHIAATDGKAEVVSLLLTKGAEPQKAIPDGREAIHLAAGSGANDTIQKLLDAGVPVAASTSEGWRPIHVAAWNDRPETIRFLLERGADPRAPGQEEETPLELATRGGASRALAVLKAVLTESGTDDE